MNIRKYIAFILLIALPGFYVASGFKKVNDSEKGILTIYNKRRALPLDSIKNSKDKTLSFLFKFKNTGEQGLTIDEVKTSCSCTGADYSKGKILPGETGEILLYTKKSSFLKLKKIEGIIMSNAINDYEYVRVVLE